MNKTYFDNIILNNLITETGAESFGYYISETDTSYPVYYNENTFSNFIEEIKSEYPDAYTAYRSGKGSEMLPAANGKNPPKMASVASSSRFCYLALRNGAQALGGGKVVFEFECSIDGIRGTAPQMDAYSADGNIFIEVKCHEIFDAHTVELSHQYYGWLCEHPQGFGLALPKPAAKEKIQIPCSVFGVEENCMFDIKQLLCHLMGISKKQPATLTYLFFKPQVTNTADHEQIELIFSKLQSEIKGIFSSKPIANFCKVNQITLRAVAQNAPVMGDLSPSNMIILY